MSRLRTYAYMNKRSEKVKDGEAEFRAVYKIVDARSEGRCEYMATIMAEGLTDPYGRPLPPDRILRFKELGRCRYRARDHHHLYKPRRSNHEPPSWPYRRGRLTVAIVNGRHVFRIVYAADKWAALRAALPAAHG